MSSPSEDLRVVMCRTRRRCSPCARSVVVAAFAFLTLSSTGTSAAAGPPSRLTLAIYAPSLPFPDSQVRVAALRDLAHAIEARTGIPTAFESFARYGDLIRSKADLAILDAPCVVVNGGQVLATASVGRETSTAWALFGRASTGGLAGLRLAYPRTGCRDDDFLDNALLGGVARSSELFGARLDKGNSVAGAVTSVLHYRDADLVFAPVAQAAGLSKVFDAGRVPGPGLVVLRAGIDAGTLQLIQAAVLGHTMQGQVIDGWRPPSGYAELAARMAPRRRQLLFAVPERPRLDVGMLAPGDSGLAPLPVRWLPWRPTPMVAAQQVAPRPEK